jgi:peptidyl-prolyl cis-trans isomerase SurA
MRFLLILILFGLAFGRARAQTQSEPVNGIVAIVNDTVITYKDVQMYIGPAMELLIRQYGQQPAVLEKKVMEAQRDGVEQLVERQLILNDFTVSGYSMPESIIEEEIRRDIKERFGDRLTLTKTLREQGMTYESYKRQTRDRIMVEALRAKNVGSEIFISPFKIENFFKEHQEEFKQQDQIKLRMIVLNKTGQSAATKRQLAGDILKQLDEGASFAELAKIYSEGSQRDQGGDWGWVEKGVLRKELADAAFKLKAGQRSGIVETPEAYYLMLVEETRGAGVKALNEVRDQIERNLIVQERARLQKKYIDRLKKKSFVRYF